MSGDKHGAKLCRSIMDLDPSAEFNFWGGDRMAEVTGKAPLKHISELAFMGFVQVIKNLGTIRQNFKLIKKQILDFKPDCLIYIDYPGFNLRLVKWSHGHGFKNFYYISPTVWAWKEGRIELIRSFVNKLFVILPFEKPWYSARGIDVIYAGNPSMEEVQSFKPDEKFGHQYPDGTIALLPGSRKQEIEHILPTMLEACDLNFRHEKFVIAKPSHLAKEMYLPVLNKFPHLNVDLIEDRFYDILHTAKYALVASGTATLETALFKVPQIVCYKASTINYRIAKFFVRLDYISLVNLISDKKVVEELIQDEFTAEKLNESLKNLITNKEALLVGYEELFQKLETKKPVSDTIASYIYKNI